MIELGIEKLEGEVFKKYLGDIGKNGIIKAMRNNRYCMDDNCLAKYSEAAGRMGGASVCVAFGYAAAAPVCSFVGGFISKFIFNSFIRPLKNFQPASGVKVGDRDWALKHLNVYAFEESPKRNLAARAYLDERDIVLEKMGNLSGDFRWADRRLSEVGALRAEEIPEWQGDRQARWNQYLNSRDRLFDALSPFPDLQRNREERRRLLRNSGRTDLSDYVEHFYEIFVIEQNQPISYEECWLMYVYPYGPPSPPSDPVDLGLIGADPEAINKVLSMQNALRTNENSLYSEASAHISFIDLSRPEIDSEALIEIARNRELKASEMQLIKENLDILKRDLSPEQLSVLRNLTPNEIQALKEYAHSVIRDVSSMGEASIDVEQKKRSPILIMFILGALLATPMLMRR